MDAIGDGDLAAFQIRAMRTEDVDDVVRLESESFSSPWNSQTFLELMGRDTLELLVMDHPREGIVGYAVVWCILDQGELANLAIVPALRGQGLGTRLLGHALDTARARGVERMYLEVRDSNTHAQGLYRHFGFEQVGLRRGYYDHPREDARILMAKL